MIVVQKKRSKRTGKILDVVGRVYRTQGGSMGVFLDSERVAKWLNKGAICTPSVEKFLEMWPGFYDYDDDKDKDDKE